MKRPIHLIAVMVSAGIIVFAVDLFFVKLMEATGLQNFWLVFVAAVFVSALIITGFSIPIYREGVRRGAGRLLQPEYLQHGKRFRIVYSFFDANAGLTYAKIFMGPYHKMCTVQYKLPAGTTHLRVVETGLSSQFEPLEVIPEDVRVLSP